jgi:hypothetical protein
MISLYDLADILNEDIVMRRHAAQGNRWTARFEHAEVQKSVFLSSEFGNGDSPEAALADYARRIAGKLLVFDAFNKDDRREISVPQEVTT